MVSDCSSMRLFRSSYGVFRCSRWSAATHVFRRTGLTSETKTETTRVGRSAEGGMQRH